MDFVMIAVCERGGEKDKNGALVKSSKCWLVWVYVQDIFVLWLN